MSTGIYVNIGRAFTDLNGHLNMNSKNVLNSTTVIAQAYAASNDINSPRQFGAELGIRF